MRRAAGPTCLDLFAGAGGLSLGLERAGWSCLLAVEFDADSQSTYSQNFPGVGLAGDIRDQDFSSYRGRATLVAGGPPCQPFSVAGAQKAAADDRDMIPEFTRAVREIKPPAFLFENVPGLATKRHADYLSNALRGFEELGYVVTHRVLDAAYYGVPQHRRRLFVVGIRGQQFKFPLETHGPGLPSAFVKVREALEGTPPDEANKAIVTYAKNPVLRPSPYAGMLLNGKGRPLCLDRPALTIPATAGGNRTHILDPDGILLKYHAHVWAGGKPRRGRVQGVRRLTLRESARLQTFPDDFQFSGKKSSRFRQVGNAVPPQLAQVLGSQLLAQLSREEATEASQCSADTLATEQAALS